MTTKVNLTRRAIAAYNRSGGMHLITRSKLVCVNDKNYVTVGYYSNVVAVYRVENSGRLKRLKRWPLDVAPPVAKLPSVTETDVLAQTADNLSSGRISGAIS